MASGGHNGTMVAEGSGSEDNFPWELVAVAMILDEDLRQMLCRSEKVREELWTLMDRAEKRHMKKRIRVLPLRCVEVCSSTTTYRVSLDGITEPQAKIPYDCMYLFMWQYAEGFADVENRRFQTAVRELQDKIASKTGTRFQAPDIARFFIMFLEIEYAHLFYTMVTDHWRDAAHGFYRPDRLGQEIEGFKGDRDRRHLPLLDLVRGKTVLDIGSGFGRIEEDLISWGAASVAATYHCICLR